jgi:hypothetical protein
MFTKKALAASVSASPAVYVEDVFSTWLYTGNGSTQTITNGIDLAGEGGLVWVKGRSTAYDHVLYDSERPNGATNFYELNSNTTDAQTARTNAVNTFSSTGFSLGDLVRVNNNGTTYASWTFRKAAKFFDVVTWVGDGTNNRAISHSLTTTPRVIIIKRTDSTSNWAVYSPASLWTGESFTGLYLNTTAAVGASTANGQGISAVGASSFTVIASGSNPLEFNPNTSGATYVAYLFAHDAGGFGDDGTESVVKCGSYTGDGSGNFSVTLGWEPQLVIFRASSETALWEIVDNMRGFSATNAQRLFPNLSNAEGGSGGPYLIPNATGFQMVGSSGPVNGTGIYIAIRRGPMKTPTSGTEVYTGITRNGTGGDATITGAGFLVDAVMTRRVGANTGFTSIFDRLRGRLQGVRTSETAAEEAQTNSLTGFDIMDGFSVGSDTQRGTLNTSSRPYIHWLFRRAPGFFDVVGYTETANPGTYSHSLGVVPEMIITKRRDITSEWGVYHKDINTSVTGGWPALNRVNSWFMASALFATAPTATAFTVDYQRGASSQTHIAYIFASCPGVSKVFSFTGNGSSQTIDCGFTAGARFVLLKRTDSTGNWLVADTARGIVSGNDPLLYLNSTAAEITTLDWIDPDSSGFVVNQESTANANVNGATYIGLAIA